MGIKTQSIIVPNSFLLLLFLMISLPKLIEKGSSVLADEMTYVRIFFKEIVWKPFKKYFSYFL